MATPNEKLSRLVIGSPCSTSWDGMQGDERKRHCAQCDRQVHDFAQRTPREIAALIEASRGQLCARLTRTEDGRLLTAEPPAPPAAVTGTWFPRRVSPVAAAVVTALLGLGGVAAGPLPPAGKNLDSGAEPARSPRSGGEDGSLRGRIVDSAGLPVTGATVRARNTLDGHERETTTGAEGEFRFGVLEAGSYDVWAWRDGFSIQSQSDLLFSPDESREVVLQAEPSRGFTTAGVMLIPVQPLHRMFAESPVVVLATAGPTVQGTEGDEYGEAVTEIRILSGFKGQIPGRSLRVVYAQVPGEDARYPPGTPILAFLKPREKEAGEKGETVYESAQYHLGLKVLTAGELEAYRERLTALARLSRGGEPHPAELTEWLVATAEERETRSEGIGELAASVQALNRLAQARGTSDEQAAQDLQAIAARFERDGGTFGSEPAPALTAAFLTAAQKERLARVLLESRRLDQVDCDLFHLVQPWSGKAALAWLAQRFQDTEPESVEVSREAMDLLAEGFGDPELKSHLETADEFVRQQVLAASSETSDPEALALEAEKDLRERFRQTLNHLRP